MKQSKHRLSGILMLITLTLLAGRAGATDKYWNPTSGNGWSTGVNWSPNGVPGAGDVAIFDGNTNNANCTLDATVNVTGMVLTNGYSGTVAQGAVNITVGSSGWSQSAGTFAGGTNSITLNGSWGLSDGAFNAGNQTVTMNNGGPAVSWAYSGGTFNAGSSTVAFHPDWNGITISGSQTFNNLTLNGVYMTHVGTVTVPAGTTLTVTNTLSLRDGDPGNVGVKFAGTGTIAAQGNIVATYMRAGNAYYGTVLLLINGAGDQTFTNAGATLSRIEMNKPSGTLSLAGTHVVGGAHNGSYGGSWTRTAGSISPGASTVCFFGDNGGLTISGSHTLGNVSFASVYQTHGNTITIAAGTTLTAGGTLTFGSTDNTSQPNINGGILNAEGDVRFALNNNCGGNAVFSFTGGATQQVTYAGTGANYFRFSPITINKTGGAVTLATDLSLGNAGQQLVWTNGALNLSSNTLTVAGAVTVHPGATTLGVTVADTNRAGRLICSSAVSSIANAGLEVSVAAAKEQSPQIQGQAYTILSNNASVGSARFESETWVGAWRGSVAYTNNGGKTVALSNIRFVAGGAVLVVR